MSNRLRKLLIVFLSVCLSACVAIAVSACANQAVTEFPDYRYPVGTQLPGEGDSSDGSELMKYNISVKSGGGLSLNGVRVTLSKNGTTVKEGISQNGKVTLSLAPDVYDISLSDLPEGYYVPEEYQYATNATESEVEVIALSKVINTTASSSTRYSLGDVMHDFTVSNVDGDKLTLSELLEEKKAVVLNFWYTTCVPCKSEFPALLSAYDAFSDKVSVLALDMQETEATIAGFRTSLENEKGVKFTFDFCRDSAGLTTYFGVTAFPTTVIIDRYGMIAYIDTGSITESNTWRSIFAIYTSDNYTQNPVVNEGEGADGAELEKPDVEMPSSSVLEAAVPLPQNSYYEAETNEADAEYSWPWLVGSAGGKACITPANLSKDSSYGIVYIQNIEIKAGELLFLDYYTNTEDGDVLYIILNGDELLASLAGNSGDWESLLLYTCTNDQTLSLGLCFTKDVQDSVQDEYVGIRNIRTVNIDEITYALDILYDCANIAPDGSVTYQDVVLGDDGYYHIRETGELVLADITNATVWSTLHYGSRNLEFEGSSYTASLYLIDFWLWEEDTSNLQFFFDGKSYTQLMLDTFYMQTFSDNGYVPVSPELREALVAFTRQFYQVTAGKTLDDWYENQWLELCHYYKHNNAIYEHDDCRATTDPVKGMVFANCYEANEGENTALIERAVTIRAYTGVVLSFTPATSGVYLVKSTAAYSLETGKPMDADSSVMLYSADGKFIGYSDDYYGYDMLTTMDYNFYLYYYLEAGQTYYLRVSLGDGVTGRLDFSIDFLDGESYTHLIVCSDPTMPGTWVSTDETFSKLIYSAISVALGEDGYYHQAITDKDGNLEYGSIVYIDFLHPNFFDANDHSLLDMIEAGTFDFSNSGGSDMTATMMNFYQMSIEGKSEDDELYGMLPASQVLVRLICIMMEGQTDEADALTTGYWLSMACYYETISADHNPSLG